MEDCSHWNFQFLPPKADAYTGSEVNSYLIHFSKAAQHCKDFANELEECRSTPLGKLVDPGSCKTHADQLLKCYNSVQEVHPKCKSSYQAVHDCLEKGGKCEAALNDYLACKP